MKAFVEIDKEGVFMENPRMMMRRVYEFCKKINENEQTEETQKIFKDANDVLYYLDNCVRKLK